MKLIKKIEMGGLSGSLYLEKYGYTYKIRGRLKTTDRMGIIARSRCYYNKLEDASRYMHSDMEILTGQERLKI